jgi:hypothetical protein
MPTANRTTTAVDALEQSQHGQRRDRMPRIDPILVTRQDNSET